ncbi:MAG TPA: cytochrome B [Cyclobacteriaceae bacterium]
MYDILLTSHSYLRYFILIMLVAVIVRSLMGWMGNKPYTRVDDRLGLYLVIFTHLQLIAGVFLYFDSPWVRFDDTTMKDAMTRYWTVEHALTMIIVVALITAARATSKRMSEHQRKHKRLVLFNTIAFILIIAILAMSGRGILGTSAAA